MTFCPIPLPPYVITIISAGDGPAQRFIGQILNKILYYVQLLAYRLELQPDVGRLGGIKGKLYLHLNKPWIAVTLR